MTRPGRRRPLALVILAIAIAAPGCGSGSKTSAIVAGGRFVDLQNFANGEPDHIDPALATSTQESQPGHLIFDGLTDVDYQTGELKPMVAESYTSNADASVWTFIIRSGVRWHNGEPVLASDFKYAWERVARAELASRVSYHLDPVKGKAALAAGTATELAGVKADDAARTLTVELEYPYSIFPATVAHLAFSPVPAKVLRALPDQQAWEKGVMIGNGPFRMKEAWRPGDSITLVRNDDFWGGLTGQKAHLDELVFKMSKDVGTAYSDFEAGNGHSAYVPAGLVEQARARYPNTIDRSVLGTYYYFFNMRDPVVGGEHNLKLREAVALAIDRRAIVDSVYSGVRKVATGFVPPAMPGYAAGLDRQQGRDLEAAKAALREWGRPPPRLKLSFNADPDHKTIALLVQGNLKEIGIESTLDEQPGRTYGSFLSSGGGQLTRTGFIADYVDYDGFMYPLFHSRAIGGDNHAQYSNPRFDALVDQARRTTDAAARQALYRQAEQLMLEDQVVVPLNWYAGQIVYAGAVQNVVQSPLQFVAYEGVWLKAPNR
ncbi:MAG: peptide ABC transporter substrate-binding protein [Acidimicrobiales bacterium]